MLFTGHDRGIDPGVEQDYQRSLPVGDAMQADVLLAYAMNGAAAAGAARLPARLIVPSWYGRLRSNGCDPSRRSLSRFGAFSRRFSTPSRGAEDDPGTPVTRQKPRGRDGSARNSRPLSRSSPARWPDDGGGARLVRSGPISRVEFSPDGGRTWADAQLEQAGGARLGEVGCAWHPWRRDEYRVVRSGDGCRRQHPAARRRRDVEPGRLRGQRGPAGPRARDVNARAAHRFPLHLDD